MTQEILQSLPVTRQRHSLLAVGKNLLNIPDEDPRGTSSNSSVVSSLQSPIITSPPQQQFQNVCLVSSPKVSVPVIPTAPPAAAYESCKPFKKRMLPDTGFGFSLETPLNPMSSNIGKDNSLQQRSAKLPRTMNADNVGTANASVIILGPKTATAVMDQENQENEPTNIQHVTSLMDLSKACDMEWKQLGPVTPIASHSSQTMKIISPIHYGSARSLLRNSPINLSMDRRNSHIISPLALTTHNRSNGMALRVRPPSHIIPPSPTNTTPSGLYRKGASVSSPSLAAASRYVRLSPTMQVRGSPLRGPQQSPILAMRKPFSPTSLLTLNNHHQDIMSHVPNAQNNQKVKFLRISSPQTTPTNNMKLVGLNNRKTVIALVSSNGTQPTISSTCSAVSGTSQGVPSMMINGGGVAQTGGTYGIQSPRSSAINLVQKSPAMYRLSRFPSN